MQKFIKDVCKNFYKNFRRNFWKKSVWKFGIFLIFPIIILTACTGKEELAFELGETNGMDSQDVQTQGMWESGSGNMAGAQIQNGAAANASSGAGAVSGANVVSDAEAAAYADGISAVGAGEPVQIYVHICGAVLNPGVYELEAGSRVFEGIKAAGGFSEDACEDYVNQAELLSDGERLVIPTMEEIEQAKEDGTYQALWAAGTADKGALNKDVSGTGEDKTGSLASGDGLVNINTATESELGNVKGIGAGKAAAIVQYRQENGNFASTEDIMKVSGIKEGTYEKIKDKITVK